MTAEPLAAALGLDIRIDEDVRESQPGEATADVMVRMLRATLAQSDARVVALFSHAAPLTELLRTLTHDEVVLPAKDYRGNHLAECMVWGLYVRDGRWKAQHLPPQGRSC